MKASVISKLLLVSLILLPQLGSAETGVFSGTVKKTFPPLPRKQLINEALRNALLQASQVAQIPSERVNLFVKTSVFQKNKKALVEDAPDFELLLPLSLVHSYQISLENSEELSLEVKVDLAKFKSTINEKWEDYKRYSSTGIDGAQKGKVSLLVVRDSERMVPSTHEIPSKFGEFTKAVKDSFVKRRVSLITLPEIIDKNELVATTRGQVGGLLKIKKENLPLNQAKTPNIEEDIPELIFLVSFGFEKKFDQERLEERFRAGLIISSLSTEKNKLLSQVRYSGDWLPVRSSKGFERLLLNVWARNEVKLSGYLRSVRTELYTLRKGLNEILFEVDRVFSYRNLNNLKEALSSQVQASTSTNAVNSVVLYGMGQGRVAFNIKTSLNSQQLAQKIEALSDTGIPIKVYDYTPKVVRGRMLVERVEP